MPFNHTGSIGAASWSRHRLRPLPAVMDAKNGLIGSTRGSKRDDGRPRNKSRWVWVVITVLIISSLGFGFAMSPSMQKSPADYVPHGVIRIEGDAQLRAQALVEGWKGTGNETSPYVIEGYEIAAMGHDRGISVVNTSCHLIIEDCYVHDATFSGISFHNVTNIVVADTEFSNGQRCIDITSSRFINIEDNKCTLANEGIGLFGCDNVTVADNNCSGNLVGINAEACSNLSLESNSAYGNVITGVQLTAVRQFLLANSSCVGGQFGIRVSLSEQGSILNSTSRDSSGIGVQLSSCLQCAVEGNSLIGHGGFGISVEGSTGCVVRGNQVSDGHSGIGALMCDELDIRDNRCESNHEQGIRVEDSANLTLTHNQCHDNGGDGMILEGCVDSLVENNNCTGNIGSGMRCDSSERCKIAHNTLQGNDDSGVGCRRSIGLDLIGNEISQSQGDGLHLVECSDVNVSDNVCNETDAGIRFDLCESCEAYNNTVTDSVIGVALRDSSGIILRKNRMVDDGVFLEGNLTEHWTTHEIGPTNTVNGRPVLYLVSVTGVEVPRASGQVILAECADVTIDGLDLSHATAGVEFAFSEGITVSDVKCSGGYIGVYGFNSSGFTVENSNCSGNVRSGVEMVGCEIGQVLFVTCRGNLEFGVRLNASSGCEISACEISRSAVGVSTESSPSAGLFVSNSISNCSDGVRAVLAHQMQLHMNEIEDCGCGIRLVDSSDMVMVSNVLVKCGLYINSDIVECWNSHMVQSDNSVNGRALVYLASVSAMALPSTAGQVVLAECDLIAAHSLNLSFCTVGLLAGFSDGINAVGCDLSGNTAGAEFAHCQDCIILSNDVRDCVSVGVSLRGCSGTVVEDNMILRCGVGIEIREGISPSALNSVVGNKVSENLDGVVINGSADDEIEFNELLSNQNCGLMVTLSNGTMVRSNTCNSSGGIAIGFKGGSGCEIANNTCSLNRGGIYLWGSVECNISSNFLYGNREHGVFLGLASSENRIWGNVFAYNNGSTDSNDPLRSQARDDGRDNRWNASGQSESVGNYWHDWIVPDIDMDGVVDAPYNVSGSADAWDYLPLATTWMVIEPISDIDDIFSPERMN